MLRGGLDSVPLRLIAAEWSLGHAACASAQGKPLLRHPSGACAGQAEEGKRREGAGAHHTGSQCQAGTDIRVLYL